MASVARHPKYRSGRAYFDVALMRMERTVRYSDFVVPVCLPEAADPDPDAHLGRLVTLTGWGLQGRNSLANTMYLQRTHIGIFSQQ